jgi:hypothetical protein
MVPCSELAVVNSRLLSLEAFSKSETDRHQEVVEALHQRLRTCMQENESLLASLQANRACSRPITSIHPCDRLTFMFLLLCNGYFSTACNEILKFWSKFSFALNIFRLHVMEFEVLVKIYQWHGKNLDTIRR